MTKAKKSLGQNFLSNEGIIREIVSSGEVKENDLVIEIGPGKGILTKELLLSSAKVLAIEKDRELVPILADKFEKEIESGQLILKNSDILEEDIKELTGNKEYKLIANIPYYITGEIIRKFLEEENKPQIIVILVQKEVAQRIIAKDSKESILSLSVKFFGNPIYIKTVKRGSFSPAPKVDSAILKIENIEKRDKDLERKFFEIVKAGFSHKRKKLSSNLEKVLEKEKIKDIFERLNIDQNIRPENLNLPKWLEIIKAVVSSNLAAS